MDQSSRLLRSNPSKVQEDSTHLSISNRIIFYVICEKLNRDVEMKDTKRNQRERGSIEGRVHDPILDPEAPMWIVEGLSRIVTATVEEIL